MEYHPLFPRSSWTSTPGHCSDQEASRFSRAIRTDRLRQAARSGMMRHAEKLMVISVKEAYAESRNRGAAAIKHTAVRCTSTAQHGNRFASAHFSAAAFASSLNRLQSSINGGAAPLSAWGRLRGTHSPWADDPSPSSGKRSRNPRPPVPGSDPIDSVPPSTSAARYGADPPAPCPFSIPPSSSWSAAILRSALARRRSRSGLEGVSMPSRVGREGAAAGAARLAGVGVVRRSGEATREGGRGRGGGSALGAGRTPSPLRG